MSLSYPSLYLVSVLIKKITKKHNLLRADWDCKITDHAQYFGYGINVF